MNVLILLRFLITVICAGIAGVRPAIRRSSATGVLPVKRDPASLSDVSGMRGLLIIEIQRGYEPGDPGFHSPIAFCIL